MRAKAAPLQALRANTPCQRANPFEDEDDDEYEDDKDPLHPQQFPLPIHQHPRSRLRLAGYRFEDSL